MQCTNCGAELTEILATHNYTIEEHGEGWVKQVGEVTYSCTNCEGIIVVNEIQDILKQVDEL